MADKEYAWLENKSYCCLVDVTVDGFNRICSNCSLPCDFLSAEATTEISNKIDEEKREAELRGRRSELKKLMNHTADNTLELDDEYLTKRFEALEAERNKL